MIRCVKLGEVEISGRRLSTSDGEETTFGKETCYALAVAVNKDEGSEY